MNTLATRSELRHRRAQLTPRAVILAVVVTALLIYLVAPLRTYLAQRDRLNQLQRQTQILEEQKALLERQVQQLKDPAYLERIARECLGMVKKGEIGFIVVPEGAEGRAGPAHC
ncbi:MAG TPA: septum formation initiator family protein [Actinomycetota bacterium]|nr:septum formation initiator family protein [Actinomycetota bacterium]